METKFKIVETDDYLLAVSDEEIKERDYKYHSVKGINIAKVNGAYTNEVKIIAYKPKGNAPELDLPLFPEIVVEDDVEKLAEEYADFSNDYIPISFGGKFNETSKRDFIAGYKSATKKYSEDDLRTFCKFYVTNQINSIWDAMELYIQSLKQPTPKWFVAETEYDCCNRYQNCIGCDATAEMINLRLKTTTIEGKVYLVGKFIYE